MKVIVVGGGPAGMLAAISAVKCGNEVIIIEKMSMCGRKLLITGKGRCNITSSLPIEDFIKYVPGNGKFLYSAFNKFTNKDIINLLQKHNIEVKEERGHRIFPISDKSSSVLQALLEELKEQKVEIKTNCKVEEILVENNVAIGVKYKKQDNTIVIQKADKVILATGGKSYQSTGSTGEGYILASKLGHTIVTIKPSLVPLEAINHILCKKMQGLSLKNVAIKLLNSENNKIIYEDFGEMIFTHFGVSGPIILSASAHLLRQKEIDRLLEQNEIVLRIDLKPALSIEKLDARLQKDFIKFSNKQFKNSLDELLPQKMIPVIIELSNISPDKKVNEITKKERETLVFILKNMEIKIKKFRSIEEAIITAGGISTKEINPKTMESKIIKRLYFAGEIIDVDAYTGGFNLQIAYSTGYVAGSEFEKETY